MILGERRKSMHRRDLLWRAFFLLGLFAFVVVLFEFFVSLNPEDFGNGGNSRIGPHEIEVRPGLP